MNRKSYIKPFALLLAFFFLFFSVGTRYLIIPTALSKSNKTTIVKSADGLSEKEGQFLLENKELDAENGSEDNSGTDKSTKNLKSIWELALLPEIYNTYHTRIQVCNKKSTLSQFPVPLYLKGHSLLI